jgi:hypothetical protein
MNRQQVNWCLARSIGGALTGWGTFILWTLASGVAAALTVTLWWGTRSYLAEGDALWRGVVFTLVTFIQPGIWLGLAQWLVVRRFLAQAGWWVLATAVGLALGMGAATVTFNLSVGIMRGESNEGAIVSFAVCGLIAGIAQWPVLRKSVTHAGWWPLASTLGHTTFLLLFVTISRGLDVSTLSAVPTGALCGAVYGIITGLPLVWLLRKPLQVRRSLSNQAQFTCGVGST